MPSSPSDLSLAASSRRTLADDCWALIILEELFWHSHAGQVSLDPFRHPSVFLFGFIGGQARDELFLVEVHALKPHAFGRRDSPHACRQDQHTCAEALPVLVHGRPSPLFPDFLAQLHRRKDISSRRAE